MGSKICFISPSPEATELYETALAGLEEPPMIVEGKMEAAEVAARRAQEQGCDVFVTPENNALFLFGKLNAPIVSIPLTALDSAQALCKAREKYGEPMALFEFRRHSAHLCIVKSILDCEIREYIFEDEQDGLAKLRKAWQEGIHAVVGGAIIVELAREVGIPCVPWLPRPEDLRNAFFQARHIASVRRMEEREAMKFRYVVEYSFSGVVVADEENRISVINPAAERIFGIRAHQAIGRSVQEVVFGDQSYAALEQAQIEDLITLNQKRLMVSRIPIVEEGKVVGTIFTFYEVSTIESMEEKIRVASHTKGLSARSTFDHIIGRSEVLRQTISRAVRFAAREDTVLITGESGTGKEIFAQSIHNASPRRNQPFVPLNCSAIPPGLLESELFGYTEGAFTGARRGGKRGVFELAHLGTIFLDEIGELPREAQGHFLRVLQEKEVMRIGDGKVTPVDVRVIAATNRPLEKALHEDLFRWDLYYRLNVLQLSLPALREHVEDVPVMASALVDKWCRNLHLARRIKQILKKYENLLLGYPWPGNVRELQNLVKRLVALVETMEGGSVEQEIKLLLDEMFGGSVASSARAARQGGLKNTLADYERELIHLRSEEFDGSKTLLAKRLGIGRTTLWRKLKQG